MHHLHPEGADTPEDPYPSPLARHDWANHAVKDLRLSPVLAAVLKEVLHDAGLEYRASWRSQQNFADATGFSVRSVGSALKGLVDRGILICQTRFAATSVYSPVFGLQFCTCPNSATGSELNLLPANSELVADKPEKNVRGRGSSSILNSKTASKSGSRPPAPPSSYASCSELNDAQDLVEVDEMLVSISQWVDANWLGLSTAELGAWRHKSAATKAYQRDHDRFRREAGAIQHVVDRMLATEGREPQGWTGFNRSTKTT